MEPIAHQRYREVAGLLWQDQCDHNAVRRVLDKDGVDVDVVPQEQPPLLIIAAVMGLSESAKLLLEYGANPLVTDADGLTAAELFEDADDETAAFIRRWSRQKASRAKRQRQEAVHKACVRAMAEARNETELRTAIERAEVAGVGRAGVRVGQCRLTGMQAASEQQQQQRMHRHQVERRAAGVDHLMPDRPTEHLCAITQQPMRHPVVAADGFSYERCAIERWLESHDRSPKTNETLADRTLRPNLDLQSLISDWEAQQHANCMAGSLVHRSTADLEAELQRRRR